MARFWTSPNSCIYVPDYVYITVIIPQPIPEPDFDCLISELSNTARKYAIDEGGTVGRRYRVDEEVIDEGNPIAIIDGNQYVTYTGEVKIMSYVYHGEASSLEAEIDYIVKEYGARVTETEICGDF